MVKFSLYMFSALVYAISLPSKAIDYALPDLNGQVQSLSQYEGKWLIVNYWATWCKTCKKELPKLVSTHKANKDKDVVVVGINFESIDQDELKAFVEKNNISYPVLQSKPIPATPLGRVYALPTTYIIDPTGKLVAGQVGLVGKEDIENYINKRRSDYGHTAMVEYH